MDARSSGEAFQELGCPPACFLVEGEKGFERIRHA
jgi:hypothetical protein